MGTRDDHAGQWARFRFSVIGSLLSSPPRRGELAERVRELAAKTWSHPMTGLEHQISESTIERWYYQARRELDPVRSLRPKIRADSGRTSLSEELSKHLESLYRKHSSWSCRLHYDNLAALVRSDTQLGRLPSYSTVRRFMKANGYLKKPRPRRMRPNEARALARKQEREVRSFELEHVGALWHLDFHHGSLPVLLANGEKKTPIALCVIDDRSRLICHLQWYLNETAEVLVHGLSQAFQKRDLPRDLQTDNGAAMVAEEVTEGLERLGVGHNTTFPYSPHQNGKQEAIWGPLEGRLLAMLEGVDDLSLELLNRASQAWVDLEYNRTEHSETGQEPLARFLAGPSVLRDCPSSEALRSAFRHDVDRRQRHSDGTVSLDARRFEIPNAYRHLRDVRLRYARWDYGLIHLVDKKTGLVLSRVFLLDREKNSDRRRRRTESAPSTPSPAEPTTSERGSLPPLLEELLRRQAQSGRPPAYLPKDEHTKRSSDKKAKEKKTRDTDNEGGQS